MLMHGPSWEILSRRRYTAFSRRRRRRVASKEGPDEAMAEFKDVVTPACTRDRERAQTADRAVVKYLDRNARAATANRRSRSGVGGARRRVHEYGATNYHKSGSGGAEREQEKSSANRRQKKRQFSSKLK